MRGQPSPRIRTWECFPTSKQGIRLWTHWGIGGDIFDDRQGRRESEPLAIGAKLSLATVDQGSKSCGKVTCHPCRWGK